MDKLPDARMLDGRFTTVNHGLGVPRERSAAAAYVEAFVQGDERIRIRRALDRAQWREGVGRGEIDVSISRTVVAVRFDRPMSWTLVAGTAVTLPLPGRVWIAGTAAHCAAGFPSCHRGSLISECLWTNYHRIVVLALVASTSALAAPPVAK